MEGKRTIGQLFGNPGQLPQSESFERKPQSVSMPRKTDISNALSIAEAGLHAEVRAIIVEARRQIASTANAALVLAYWHIGRLIVEKQGGAHKAAYGDKLIQSLSARLSSEFGKGFDPTNLRNMRSFHLAFPMCDTLCRELSWSHYRLLMRIENAEARDYYHAEARRSLWSVRELQRQIHSFHYERLLSARGKRDKRHPVALPALAAKESMVPDDVIRDPVVLEFLGLVPNADFNETELESRLISHLQRFLLELGRGFSFVARQRRLTLDGEHYHVDLVFYNYLLRCFVLVDLKTRPLRHEDLGQMMMYVHYYERELMNPGDNPPIGIVLCTDKGADLVRYTLSESDKTIFAAKYSLVLPTEEELLAEIRRERVALEDAAMAANLPALAECQSSLRRKTGKGK